jgi:ATPase
MAKRKSRKKKIDVLVPDTSVIVRGLVSDYLKKDKIRVEKIIINEAVLSELEYQANSKRESGKKGLEEIKKIRKSARVEFLGRKPLPHEIKNAKKGGEIDALIRKTAFEEKGVLITADKVQAMVAEAKGIKCIFIETSNKKKGLDIFKLFGKVHKVILKEGEYPLIVKGSPGRFRVERKRKKIKEEEIRGLFEQAMEESIKRDNGFIEVNKKGFSVIRIGDMRMMLTEKPIANKTELVLIKKLKDKGFYDYKINLKYIKRIENAKKIFVIGRENSGQNVFCEGLLKYLDRKNDVCCFVNDFNIIVGNDIMQYKRKNDSLDIIKDSGKDYVYTGKLFTEEDGLLIRWLDENKIKPIVEVDNAKLVDAIEKIINTAGLKGIEDAVIVKINRNKVKNIYEIRNNKVIDLFKDKVVLNIENA